MKSDSHVVNSYFLEIRRIKEEECPLLARVLLGPHEEVVKVFIMDKKQTDEISNEVSTNMQCIYTLYIYFKLQGYQYFFCNFFNGYFHILIQVAQYLNFQEPELNAILHKFYEEENREVKKIKLKYDINVCLFILDLKLTLY